MALAREDVRKVALLARLELQDREVDRQMVHINQLLQQFEQLQALDVSGIEPTSHSIPMFNVMRDDVELADRQQRETESALPGGLFEVEPISNGPMLPLDEVHGLVVLR